MRRFLFVISDTGGGHRAAAQAVRDEMVRLYGAAVDVAVTDILVETGRWPFDRGPSWYPWLVGLNSIPWSIGYALTNSPFFVRTVTQVAWPYIRTPLRRFFQQHPAEVIVSFHGVPNYALTLAQRRMGLSIPVAVVVLDLVNVHAMWFPPDAHACFVPTETAGRLALRWGVPPERLERFGGMPVRRAFVEARGMSKAEARARLGLPQEQPVVLLVGGGEGMGPLEPVVRALVRQRPAACLVAIAGRNQRLYERLRRLDSPLPLRVEGFVPNLEVWMRAADVLVTKAGPNTMSEAFVTGAPLVLCTAVQGQESGNANYVVESGAGVWAPRPEQVAQAVIELLADPSRREAMAARSRALACPEAAEVLARRLWEIGLRDGL